MAGPSDPPPTRSPKLLDGIETAAQELMKLHPGSPHPKAIADAAAALRKAMRPPLPEGWKWTNDGYLHLSSRETEHVATSWGDGMWVLFDRFDRSTANPKSGQEKDEEAARIAVEDWFWANGWPK